MKYCSAKKVLISLILTRNICKVRCLGSVVDEDLAVLSILRTKFIVNARVRGMGGPYYFMAGILFSHLYHICLTFLCSYLCV